MKHLIVSNHLITIVWIDYLLFCQVLKVTHMDVYFCETGMEL